MVERDPHTLMQEWVAAVDRHDLGAIAALFLPDARFVLSGPMFGRQVYVGPDGVWDFYTRLLAVAPGLRSQLRSVLAAGERVAAEYAWATADDPDAEWRPTAVLAETRAGRFAELRFYRADLPMDPPAAG